MLSRPDLPVIVLTAFGSLETAVSAIRAGAYDFISKPVAIDALLIAIDRAAKNRALREEVKRLKLAIERRPRFEQLIGESAAMAARISTSRARAATGSWPRRNATASARPVSASVCDMIWASARSARISPCP